MENNGRSIEDIWIHPVRDERDVASTWDSIVRQYDGGKWPGEQFADVDFSHLLPFGDDGTGDRYCFDYGRVGVDGEAPVVICSHDTGETEDRGASFAEFVEAVVDGEWVNGKVRIQR